jgi:SAM-dependent methyltransferase
VEKDKILYVHYGAGLICPKEWLNFDVSPTLRIQKIPFFGKKLAKKLQGVNFPLNLKLGDIVKGLPVPAGACQGVYCSHVLEHLSRENAIKALHHTYQMLAPGGTFRCVLPDLEVYAQRYLENVRAGNPEAAHLFMRETCLGLEDASDGWRGPIRRTFGNYPHLWMWDKGSFEAALSAVGFTQIRRCTMGDSDDPMFKLVERSSRFKDALAYECKK